MILHRFFVGKYNRRKVDLHFSMKVTIYGLAAGSTLHRLRLGYE